MGVVSDEEYQRVCARVADLETALEQSNSNLAVTFRLPPAMNKLLGLLIALPNVTSEMVHQRLEIATDAKVAVHRLRGLMKPHGIQIHSRRNLGYWIENADKARIRDMLKPAVIQSQGSTVDHVAPQLHESAAA